VAIAERSLQLNGTGFRHTLTASRVRSTSIWMGRSVRFGPHVVGRFHRGPGMSGAPTTVEVVK
jgi:hypothetical protein